MADSPVTAGQVLAGKYRVEKVLGSGGMGVVVAAWHLELEQRIAVKFLHPLALERPDTAERFRREARAAAKIRSEHVARVIDVGIMEGGLPYMVMEYLDGHDVAQELSRTGPLPISNAIDFTLQAIEALAEAHAAGIVHRDLKPANLFLSLRPDGSQLVKVLDFGISKSLFGASVAEMSLTRTASLIGSPLYMSPEQMRSAKDVDTRTDIWSIGVMLYEMISGRPPYTGDSIPALCAALLNDSPKPLHELRPEVSPSLEEAIMRCLAKDREHRFATVSELARALAPFGSSSSQLHVDRASRVQGAVDVTISAFSAGPMTARSASPARSEASLPSSQLAVTPIQGSPMSETPAARGTVDSWGRTDGPQAVSPIASRASWITALGFGVVGLIAAVIFFEMRGPSARAAASATVETKPLSPTADVTAQTAAPAPTVVPAVSASPPEAPSAAEPAAPSATVAAEGTTKFKATPPGQKSKPKAGAAPAKKELGSSDISEFGGRR
ncbi:MAG TPA: serine/threonine-protein kinase [Polyangiaceae bacterium]|jgi:serine/threonine-protein kinase